MSRFNFWLGISKEMQDDMVRVIRDDEPAQNFPLLGSLGDETKALFETIYDANAMDRLYKKWSAQGRSYRVWSCYADKPQNVSSIRADIDNLIAVYPDDFSMLGAWHYDDGRPVGMQWDDSEPPVLVGTPWYPTPAQTINFMPDIIVDNSDPDNPVYGPATEVTDVLMLLGQAHRNFVMA